MHNHISTTNCDSCNLRRPCAVIHHQGTPVLTVCKTCEPETFERTARRDIDEWLSKGR